MTGKKHADEKSKRQNKIHATTTTLQRITKKFVKNAQSITYSITIQLDPSNINDKSRDRFTVQRK